MGTDPCETPLPPFPPDRDCPAHRRRVSEGDLRTGPGLKTFGQGALHRQRLATNRLSYGDVIPRPNGAGRRVTTAQPRQPRQPLPNTPSPPSRGA